MNQLQQALAKVVADNPDSDIAKMGKVALQRSKKPRRKKRKVSLDPVKAYHQRLKRTAYVGLGPMRPCSFTDWRPGQAVQVDGNTGRIKWGLSDGTMHMVVILFDYEQDIPGVEGGKTFYGFANVETLKPCSCKGYLHKGSCKP